MERTKIIAVDFDGTLIRGGFPNVENGEPNTRLFKELIKAQKRGDKIILWTCRDGKLLQDALAFCHRMGLVFDFVNENDPENMEALGFDHEPRKVVADLYIDDLSVQPKWGDE